MMMLPNADSDPDALPEEGSAGSESDHSIPSARQDASPAPNDDETQEVSKSERKREAERITLLGKSISELGEPDIRRLPLDERVLDAVLALRRITTHGARKRQLLFLGKLLRKSNLTEIESGLIQLQQAAKAATQQFHTVENWRDKLLNEGADTLSAFLQTYPECDRQRLRQLLRNAQREKEMGKPPKSTRELFKLLRDSMSG